MCRSRPPLVRSIGRAGSQTIARRESPAKKNRKEMMMRFLCVYKPGKPEGTPPSEQEMGEMGKLIEEWMKSGVLLATEGCLPSALGARVRRSGEKITVTDGRFTEAKELIGGFAPIQARS